MYKSRKKPMRTYGRKKSRVRYIRTNISIQNNTNSISNCNTSAEFNANPPKRECNLFEVFNSSSERKFDLLVGKKPTNIFSSSNSSLSTSEQLSGLKGSSLITSLGSILENVPLPSTSQAMEMERRVAELRPRNDAEKILKNAQFEVTKHVCLSIPSKARKSRISKRFSFGRSRENIGNSTPVKRIKELENQSIEEWGLSPIVGKGESDSLNLSNSPATFELDSDNEEQSLDDNHVVPNSSRLARRKSIKRRNVKLNRNRRKSTFLPAVKKRENDEVTENHSVLSCQADLSKDTLKDSPLPTLNETSSLSSEKDTSISNLFSKNDDVDQQTNNDISFNELPRKFSHLEIGTLPDKYDSDDCNQLTSDVEYIDSPLNISKTRDDSCLRSSRSLKTSGLISDISLAESRCAYGSVSPLFAHVKDVNEIESTSNISSRSTQSFHSECCKRIEEQEEDEEHEISSDKSHEETANEDDGSVKFDDALNICSRTFKSDNDALDEENYDDEEEDYDDEEYVLVKEDDDGDVDDEKEDDDEEEDFYEKEHNGDVEVKENNANSTKNTMLENSKFETTNVLDADNSFMCTGFELANERTFGFIPGKKYRRSLAALRFKKSSIVSEICKYPEEYSLSCLNGPPFSRKPVNQESIVFALINLTCHFLQKRKNASCNLSRVGCNRYSIIRPLAKLEESTRMTLITTTLDECLDETLPFINVDEDKNAAKQQVLRLCNQSDILSFDSVLTESPSTKLKKIGEGVYGEVFMITHLGKKEESIVVKIIPVEGDIVYNDEVQKKFHEIISEIYISQALSNLKKDDIDKVEFWTDVYCNIIASNCFQGKYPPFLMELWNIYDKQNRSENDSPKIFPEDQLYISLKMSHGGEDLQHHQFASARQSYYIVMQVIFALAVAERALQFEHRDLHIGNILISKTNVNSVFFKIDGKKYKLPTFLRKATIIDYTLSRIKSENHLFYNDLEKDEELFLGEGDIQFQVYRDMREDLMNEWQTFEPKTNIRWMHYLATKCFRDVEYINTSTRTHESFIEKLMNLANEVLLFNSCHDYVLNSGLPHC